jgi:hypothetical protein
MNQLVQEREDDPPGAGVASTQLAHLMFIQILRVHFDSTDSLATGCLRAVTDKRLAPALQMMHGEPGRSWHLDELARASAMSRATFAMLWQSEAHKYGDLPLNGTDPQVRAWSPFDDYH